MTRVVIVSRIGQPATVRYTPMSATPSTTTTLLTMPSSVIGRWISGSSTVASAACTACSIVPAGFVPVVTTPCYVRLRPLLAGARAASSSSRSEMRSSSPRR